MITSWLLYKDIKNTFSFVNIDHTLAHITHLSEGRVRIFVIFFCYMKSRETKTNVRHYTTNLHVSSGRIILLSFVSATHIRSFGLKKNGLSED